MVVAGLSRGDPPSKMTFMIKITRLEKFRPEPARKESLRLDEEIRNRLCRLGDKDGQGTRWRSGSQEEDESSTDKEMTAAEGILMDKEKGAIRGLSLPALLTQEALADEGQEPSNDEHSDVTGSCLDANRARELQTLFE